MSVWSDTLAAAQPLNGPITKPYDSWKTTDQQRFLWFSPACLYICVHERERAEMTVEHFAPKCPLEWHLKAGISFFFLAPFLNTLGPDYSLPLETAEIKNDRQAGRDKFTLGEPHSLQTGCRVCAVWPNSTSRVSRLKAKPSAAAKQIRLEMQSSAQQQDNKTEGRQIDGSRESCNNVV